MVWDLHATKMFSRSEVMRGKDDNDFLSLIDGFVCLFVCSKRGVLEYNEILFNFRLLALIMNVTRIVIIIARNRRLGNYAPM